MSFFDILKKSRRQINRENQEQGKAGERRIREKYEFSGYKVKRTGKGHDLKAEKKDWWTGKKETKYIEVKTGNSKLSRLQKKKRSQFGNKYVVERLSRTPFGLVSNNRESDKPKRRTERSNSGLFGFENASPRSDSTNGKGKTAKRRTTRKKSTKDKPTSIWGDSTNGKGKTAKRRTTRKKSTKDKPTSIWGDSTNGKGKTAKRRTTRKKSTKDKPTSDIL